MITKKQLLEIADFENVSNRRGLLEEYSRDMSFVNQVLPDSVVKPQTAAEIEKIIKLANDTLTPLVPVSSGPPHYRGDTVPTIAEAVIVDLSGMKKIIRIDRNNRAVMFEPGVTFGELIPAVAKEGLRLNTPLLPRKTKSVVGSMLEREPVIMPKYQWDAADPLCNVEIVFGSGQVFRTGAAAGPGTLEEQWEVGGAQKEAAGPSTSSWYRVIQGAQGTMGIVTWASARCEILPRREEPFLVGSNDLDKLIEMVYWLIRLRLVNECFILNNNDMATLIPKTSPAEYGALKHALPRWLLFYNVAGYNYFPEERVSGQIQDIAELAQRISVEPQKAIGRIAANELLELVQSPPGDYYWKQPLGWSCQDIFFVSNFQKVNNLVATMFDIAAEAGYAAGNLGVYIQPVVQGANFHCEFNLFYDPANRSETETVRYLAAGAPKALMSQGAFFSRPYGESTGLIMNRDAATVAALKKVKTILDPNNIMNPGKLCF